MFHFTSVFLTFKHLDSLTEGRFYNKTILVQGHLVKKCNYCLGVNQNKHMNLKNIILYMVIFCCHISQTLSK